MYIRKRISPSRRQTPSYQILETYREFMTGKVKQRVLINLGSCPDLQTALEEARQQRRQQRTAGRSIQSPCRSHPRVGTSDQQVASPPLA